MIFFSLPLFCSAGSGTQGFVSAKAAGTLGPCVCVLLQPRQQVLRRWEVVALEADPPPCWAENNTTLASPTRGGSDDRDLYRSGENSSQGWGGCLSGRRPTQHDRPWGHPVAFTFHGHARLPGFPLGTRARLLRLSQGSPQWLLLVLQDCPKGIRLFPFADF